MANNQNNKKDRARRRGRHDGPNFIQLFRYMLNCPAYVSLSPAARSALIEVNRGYNGSNNGRIVLSVREVAGRVGCHRDTAAKALQELVAKGFIERRTKGAFSMKFRRATEWRLNDRRCDVTGAAQSQAFLRWAAETPREGEPKTKTRSYAEGPYGPTEPDTTRIPEPPSRSYAVGHYKAPHGPTAWDTSICTMTTSSTCAPGEAPATPDPPAGTAARRPRRLRGR